MKLILYNRGDAVVPQIEYALAMSGALPDVVYLNDLELTQGVGWDYLDPDIERSAIRTPGGRRIHDVEVTGVVNRLRWIEPPNFPKEVDRQYASMEIYALLVAWLERLPCEVVNRSTPRGLAGGERTLAEWYTLAAHAGVATRGMRYITSRDSDVDTGWSRHPAPTDRWGSVGPALHRAVPSGNNPMMCFEQVESSALVHLVRGRVLGAPDHGVAAGVRRLGDLARLGIAEFEFGWSVPRAQWVLVDATPYPEDLPGAGIEELAAMCLGGRSGGWS